MSRVLLYGLMVMPCALAKRFVHSAIDPDAGSVQAEHGPKREPATFCPGESSIQTHVTETSEDEKKVLKELFVPLVVGRFGTGRDVKDGRQPYNNLEFLDAFKVVSSPDMSAYEEYKKEIHAKRTQAQAAKKTKKKAGTAMAQANAKTTQASTITAAAASQELLPSSAESKGKATESLGKAAEYMGKAAESLGEAAESLGKAAESLGKPAESPGEAAESMGKAAKEDSHGDEFWVDTCRNDVQQMAREHNMTGENEYLLMKGTRADRLWHHICYPRKGEDINTNLDAANYGYGVYLSDASDKIDQYTGPPGSGWSVIKKVLESKDRDQFLEFRERFLDTAFDDVVIVEVHKAYMGKHVEVQIDYQSCLKEGDHDNREIMWHYRDPWNSSPEDISIYEKALNFSRIPPFEDWDSIKVMSTAFNPEYSENIRPGTSLSPNRHNEFIVRRTDQSAIEYIAAYARKWDADNPAKPLACATRTGEQIPRPPRTPRPPCTPCSDEWKYEGKRGRLLPGEKELSPTCADKK